MLALNEEIYQLVMANSVHGYEKMLKNQNDHILRMVLEFVVEGQRFKQK